MNDRRRNDGTARHGRPAASRIELSPSSRSHSTATAETLRDERLGRVSADQPTPECAPPAARSIDAGIAPDRAGFIGCGLCDGLSLVVAAHVPECLKSQWFDDRPAWNCVETCPRANCPACHPAARGEGSA